MSLAPINFGLGEWMQEIPGTFNPRTGKVEYPEPEVLWDRGRMASDVFFPAFNQPFGGGSKRPLPFDGSFEVEDTPLNRQAFPEAFESRFGIAQKFPEYMQAGGPSLFPIKKNLPGEVKGIIRGVQGGSRNDLSKPYGGLRKAGMLFDNEGLFSA